MKKILIILPAIVLLTVACTSNNKSQPLNQTPTATQSTTTTVTPQKFSDSTDYQSAVLISGDTLSAEAQKSLTGFSLSRQLQMDGSISINLKALESGYQSMKFIVKPGQQLYFVDRSLGDDSGKEYNQRDDYGIIVDSQGYIVSAGL